MIKREGDLFPEDDKPMQLKPFDSVKPSTKDEKKYMPYSTERKDNEIEKGIPKNVKTPSAKLDSGKTSVTLISTVRWIYKRPFIVRNLINTSQLRSIIVN